MQSAALTVGPDGVNQSSVSLHSESFQSPIHTRFCLLLALPGMPAVSASFKAPGIITYSMRSSLTPSDPAIAFVPSHHSSSSGSLPVCLWALSLCFLGGMVVTAASISQSGCKSEVRCSRRGPGPLSVCRKHCHHFYYFHQRHTNKAPWHSVSSCACDFPAGRGFVRSDSESY